MPWLTGMFQGGGATGQGGTGGLGPATNALPTMTYSGQPGGDTSQVFTPASSMSSAGAGLVAGVQAGGTIFKGITQANAMRANANIDLEEGRTASTQASQEEAQKRQSNSAMVGRMAAAAAQSGSGPGGSTGRAIVQSARNADLDALNIRYKGQLQRWAYDTQAQMTRKEASGVELGGIVGGASQLLQSAGSYF